MRKYERYDCCAIELLDIDTVSEVIELHGAFRFKPAGRFQWFQSFLWKCLHEFKALETVHQTRKTATRITINPPDIVEKLLRHRKAVLDRFHSEADTLIIGSEEFSELCGLPATYRLLEVNVPVGYDGRIVNMNIKVVPWMRGMLIVPFKLV